MHDKGVKENFVRHNMTASAGTYFCFSSGTTGSRKLIQLSVSGALGNAKAHGDALGASDHCTIWQTLPIQHSFGLIAFLFTPIYFRCKVRFGVFASALDSEKFDDEYVIAHLTPSHIEALKAQKFQPRRRVQKLSIGAGPLKKDLAEFAQNYLCQKLYTTYGLTEAGPRVTCGKVDISTYENGWVGNPLKGVSLKLDRDGKLFIKSEFISLGASQSDFFDSGDYFRKNSAGEYIFVRRDSDLFRIRGRTSSRFELKEKLENLLNCPCEPIQQESSDDIKIFIEGPRNENLVELIRNQFLELKNAEILFIKALPRTILGKVDIQKLMNGELDD